MKRSGYLAVILGGILLGSQMLLPLAAETMLERSLKQSVRSAQITADVDALPALSLVCGTADTIVVTGKDVLIGKLLCSEVSVSADKVDVDMTRLVGDGKLLFRRIGHARASAWVDEDDLADVLRQSVRQLTDAKVTITPSGIEARGKYALGKSSADIVLTGQIIGRDDKICFVSEQVTLQYAAIGNLSARLKTEVELADLSALPFAVRITEIRPSDGRILLVAEKENTSPQ